MSRFGWGCWLGLVAALVVGCGGGDAEKEGGGPRAEILTFQASAAHAEVGDEITLAWETRHAKEIRLYANEAELELADPKASSSSIAHRLEETTVFRLVAVGEGAPASLERVVEARTIPPRILSFTAEPHAVDEGEEVVLAWETELAEAIAIGAAGGDPLDLGGADPASGSIVVRPMEPTTYVLTATRRGQTTSRSVQVQIKAPPQVQLSGSPAQVEWGESVGLQWVAENAETIRLYRGDLLLAESEEPTGGHEDVPPFSATYRAVAIRGEKESESALPILVQPKVLAFAAEDAIPTPIGAPVTLTWEVGGAEHLTIHNGGGETFALDVGPEESSSTALPLGPDGAFHLAARSGDLVAHATAHVPILHRPTIASFEADEELVSGEADRSALVTLRWSGVVGADTLELEGDTTGPVDLSATALEAGEVEVEVIEDTEFTLRATNAAGQTTAAASVRVVPYPTIERFIATPSYVGEMENFELEWKATGHTVQLFEGEDLLSEADALVDRIELARAASTTFTLRVANEAGATTEETVELWVGPLTNVHLVATPTYVAPGDTVTLAWSNLGGRSLEVTREDGGLVCESTELEEITEGHCAFVIDTEGAHTFHFRLRNGIDADIVETFEVLANAGPRILSFSVVPPATEVGRSLAFLWEVAADPHGNTPTLTLSDGENDYDLSGTNPHQGNRSFPMASPGPKTFTLTASTPLGIKTATADATVHGLPQVSLGAHPETYDLTTPVELRWTSAHAASLVLYALDDEGRAIEPPLHVVPAEERAAGSFSVAPAVPTSYRLVAENAMGSKASDEARVEILPPTIGSFTANPAMVTLAPGEETTITLQWSGVERAAVLELTSDTLGAIDLSGLDAANDSIEVTIAASSRFTLRATNGGGSVSRVAEVTAVPPARILQFTLSPTVVEPFENVTVTWVVEDAIEAELISYAVPSWFTPELPSGQFELMFGDEDTTVELKAWNAAGDEVSAVRAVQVVPAGIDSFTVSETYVPTGTELTFEWETRAGRGLQLELGDDVLFSTSDFERIASGSHSLTIASEGRHEFVLAMTNHRGIRYENRATVEVSDGPIILDFLAMQDDVEVGEMVTFYWKTRNDPHGETPTLTLSDGTRNYDLGGTDPNHDLRSFFVNEPGVKTFTLTATTSLGAKSRDVEVRVHPPLSATLSANPPMGDLENPIELSWNSLNADGGLYLYELDSEGRPVEPPLYAIPEDERAVGCLFVEPAAPTTYRLVAIGALGREIHDEVRVEILPPEILSFALDADEVLEMGWLEVSWTTRRATGVHLGRSHPMDVTETSEPFLDISGTGTPLALTPVPLPYSDGGYADIEFPPSFRFPFGGVERDRIRVMENGHAGFHFDTFGNSGGNWPLPHWLPNGTGRNAHLMPFWENLDAGSYKSDGQIFYEFGADARGERLIIQWHEIGTYDHVPNGLLTFQIVLWEDGAFDFRYDEMQSSHPSFHLGGSATIGYQSPDAGHFLQLHHGTGDTPIPGGLAHRTFAFREAELPPNGSLFLVGGVPVDEIVLTAKGPGGEVADAEGLTVHPSLRVEWSAPREAVAGEFFEVEWTAVGATTVSIRGPDYVSGCFYPPGPVDQGVCQLQAPSVPGDYIYSVMSTGPLSQQTNSGWRLTVHPAP